jgi:phosphoglycolate phosphatase-like HAD superfamily hydrolase
MFRNPENNVEIPKTIEIISDFENEQGQHPKLEIDKNAPGVFLIDIDGTLADAKKIHNSSIISLYRAYFPNDRRFLDQAFQKEFALFYFSNFGLGEKQEQEILCRHFNIGVDRETLEKITSDYGNYFSSFLKNATEEERKKIIIPGVKQFLENLKRNKFPAAIVTGNIRQSAQAIMKYLGFSEYFITGGFDDDITAVPEGKLRRTCILESALNKLRRKGLPIISEQTVVVGDTPKDFKAAMSEGKKSGLVILVSSGDYSLEKLDSMQVSQLKPDLVLPELHLTGESAKDRELLNRITKKHA